MVAVAGLLLSSCTVDELPAEGGAIIAEMETDQTRTAVTDEGTFTWSAGDKVWLHTTTGSVLGTLSSGAGSSSAKFTYDGFVGEMTGKAAYPYNDGHSVSEEALNFVLPASYDLGSSLTNTNAAMYGVNVGGTIRFNHLAGVMRFKFKDVPAGVNKFTITLDKKINGTFAADLSQDYPTLVTSETSVASEKTITFNFDALSKTSDISLYIPLPTGKYTSLALDLYAGSNSVWTYSNTVTNTIHRKTLKLMPVVTLGGSVGGDIEGGDSENLIDYVDEYGVNHGPGVRIGETIWAPVNCGYHETDYKYGKLYQWGRKYGQGYDDENPTGSWFYTGDDGVTVEEGNNKYNAIGFYKGSISNLSDWAHPHDDTLWNSGTEQSPSKSQYDPCPDGWRVPTYAELNVLKTNHSSLIETEDGYKGYWFTGPAEYSETAQKIFLPLAGQRYSSGSYRERNSYGYYWSSKPAESSKSYYLIFYSFSNSVKMDSYEGRASGNSLRCVSEY